MLHPCDISDGIVEKSFDVITNGFSIARMQQLRMFVTICVRHDWFLLSQMLSSRCTGQPVHGVVGIVVTWFDTCVAKEYRLLGVVTNRRNVSNRIIDITNILNLASRKPIWPRVWAVSGDCLLYTSDAADE